MTTISHTMDQMFPRRVVLRYLTQCMGEPRSVRQITKGRGKNPDLYADHGDTVCMLVALEEKGRVEYAGDSGVPGPDGTRNGLWQVPLPRLQEPE